MTKKDGWVERMRKKTRKKEWKYLKKMGRREESVGLLCIEY